MRPGPRRASRGFTLVELLVALAASSVVIVIITMTFLAQVQQYRRHVSLRAAQAGSRMSLGLVQDAVRRAGYGVDPDRAILAFDSFDAASPLAQAANFPDAITTNARSTTFDPRAVSALDAGSITFAGPLKEKMRLGQILVVLCDSATEWAYVTVGALAAPGATRVTLLAPGGTESPTGLPGPRFRENTRLTSGCFSLPGVRMVAVERSSFFVAQYDSDNSAQTPVEPYLMYHEGLDLNEDGQVDLADASPVSADVEQLQVAYVLNTLDGSPPAILGVTAADVPWGDTWATGATSPPAMGANYTDPTRLSLHPANIRQVRVTVVARGTAGSVEGDDYNDPTNPMYEGAALANGTVPWRQMENLGAAPTVLNPKAGHFARRVLRLSILPKNLLMRSQFVPPNTNGG